MALDKNKVPISFAQGLDTKSDPKQVQPGKFLTLENAVFLKNGMIQKCNGYAYKAPIFPDTPLACATLKDGFFAVGQRRAFAYSPTRDTLNIVGKYLPLTISKFNGINQDANYACCAFDEARNTLLFVWEEYDASSFPYAKIKYLAIDIVTNSICYNEALLNQGQKPRVVTTSAMDYFLVIYEDSTGTLLASAIRKNNFDFFTTVTLDSSANYDTYGYSVYSYGAAYVAWSVNAGVNTKVAYFPLTYASFAAPTPITISGSSCKNGSAMFAYANNVIIFTNSGSQLKLIGYNDTLTSVTQTSRTIMTTPGYATKMNGVVVGLNESGNMQVFTTVLDSFGVDELPRVQQAVVTPSTTVTNRIPSPRLEPVLVTFCI